MSSYVICERYLAGPYVPTLGIHPHCDIVFGDLDMAKNHAQKIGGTAEAGRVELVVCELVEKAKQTHDRGPWINREPRRE
jgi:hypothetical protein